MKLKCIKCGREVNSLLPVDRIGFCKKCGGNFMNVTTRVVYNKGETPRSLDTVGKIEGYHIPDDNEEEEDSIECALCHKSVDEDDSYECDECGETFCNDCCFEFEDAGIILCKMCIDHVYPRKTETIEKIIEKRVEVKVPVFKKHDSEIINPIPIDFLANDGDFGI